MVGNDIRFTIDLVGEDLAHKVIIQSANAYFINKEAESYSKFANRYPEQVFDKQYSPSNYCLNNSGNYCYNAEPLYKKCDEFYKEEANSAVISVPVRYTWKRNVVEVYFPASSQKNSGIYDFVISAQVVDTNYKYDNIRNITVSYEGLVELTENTEALPYKISNIVITEEPQDVSEDAVEDIFAYRGNVEDSKLKIDLTDGNSFEVDMSDQFDWYDADPEQDQNLTDNTPT